MFMSRYWKLFLRKFLQLAIIVVAVFAALYFLKMLDLEQWRVKGPILGGVMLAWAAIYPLVRKDKK